MTEAWEARIEAQVSELLEQLSPATERERQLALSRQCPFKRQSALYNAWWRTVREVRARAKKEREGVR